MSTIHLNLNVAKSVASLIALTNQKDAPIYGLIRLEFTGDHLIAIATDKYSLAVAKYDVTLYTTDPFVMFLNADDAKFIAGLKPNKFGENLVEFEVGDTTVKISFNGASLFSTLRGTYNYPPVQSLVENWQPANDAAELAINMQRFASYSKLIGSDGKKIEKWSMKLGANAANPAKPAPLRFEAGQITVLAQPMIL